MQTKHLFLFSALTFLACAGLQAQVTIGGLTEPKPGTILDLNSTVKGGLILSNVYLENLFEIPVTFPGAEGADAALLKAGLKGAVIYNTNPATCVGVHVWDGTYWERTTSETPAQAPGTLSITSGSANSLGSTNIEFTAAPGALTYKWYESIGGAPYECIGVTATGIFSKTYMPGNYKVKVVTDNCRLEESNEVLIAPETLSPGSGSIAGGNIIYIYGDFPYAATSEYVAQANLIAHFDGINNQGKGDRGHDFHATSWKELKSGFDLPKTGDGQWLSNGFQSNDNAYAFFSSDCPSNFPSGSGPRTVEVIFRTPNPAYIQDNDVVHYIFGYGPRVDNGQVTGHGFTVGYRGRKNTSACSPTNPWVFYAIGGINVFLVTCLSSTPDLEKPDFINTVTSTYHTNMSNPLTNSYINATAAQIVERTGTLNSQLENLAIGYNMVGSTILSARLYNDVLDLDDIKENARLDKIRYLNPPEVKINNVACTEVVVLSPHFLMCRVPASPGGSTGAKNVYVNGVNYSGAYTYVDASEFYVSSITPILGSAGETLTLTGHNLDEISELKIGDIPCSPSEPPTSAEYKCLIPPGQTGEVGITITTTGGKTYRFAKVFEYTE